MVFDPFAVRLYKCQKCRLKKITIFHLFHCDYANPEDYKCRRCGSVMSTTELLEDHLQDNEPNSKVKKYFCGDCAFKTYFLTKLLNHVCPKASNSQAVRESDVPGLECPTQNNNVPHTFQESYKSEPGCPKLVKLPTNIEYNHKRELPHHVCPGVINSSPQFEEISEMDHEYPFYTLPHTFSETGPFNHACPGLHNTFEEVQKPGSFKHKWAGHKCGVDHETETFHHNCPNCQHISEDHGIGYNFPHACRTHHKSEVLHQRCCRSLYSFGHQFVDVESEPIGNQSHIPEMPDDGDKTETNSYVFARGTTFERTTLTKRVEYDPNQRKSSARYNLRRRRICELEVISCVNCSVPPAKPTIPAEVNQQKWFEIP